VHSPKPRHPRMGVSLNPSDESRVHAGGICPISGVGDRHARGSLEGRHMSDGVMIIIVTAGAFVIALIASLTYLAWLRKR